MYFKYLVWLAAFVLAGCAAFVSVSGLGKLFAGGGLAIYLMIGGLEFAKLVSASMLHRYWDRLSSLIRIYLTIGVIVLVSITSMGIYGYLSDGYQRVSNVVNVENSKISTLENKKARFEKSITDNERTITYRNDRVASLTDLRSQQENRLDSLLVKNYVSNANKVRGDIDKSTDEINRLNTEIESIMVQNNVLYDSVAVYQDKIYEITNNSSVSAELGPLIFLSEATSLPMAVIVNYLIIIIMLVFDPLAVILLISANKLNELEAADRNTYNDNYYTADDVSPVSDYEDVDVDEYVENIEDAEVSTNQFVESETIVEQSIEDAPKPEPIINPQPSARQPVIPKGRITRDDIPLVQQAVNRGFTVRVPNPKKR